MLTLEGLAARRCAMNRPILVAALSVLGLAAPVAAQTCSTTTEEFTTGSNLAGWAFIPGLDVIESTGGNPGYWLHNALYDTFAPILTSDGSIPSAFAGDYRAMDVTRISLDARTISTQWGEPVGFSMSILLRDTKGTSTVNDDDYAYFVGPNVPLTTQGWVHYDFAIPSSSTTPVPPGWTGGWAGDCCAFRPGIDWNDVIQSVDRVEFWWLDPSMFAIFRQWAVGADNVSIRTGTPPPASATVVNAGTNHLAYSLSGPPVLGTTVQAAIDVAGTGHTHGQLFGYPGPLSLTLGPRRTVLVDFTGPELLGLGAVAGPIGTYDLPVPGDCAFAGLGLSTQAAVFTLSAPPLFWELTNAVDLVVGG